MTSYLASGRSLRSWLVTKDHKRIGILFLIATTLALVLGGVFALLIRIELLTPEPSVFDALDYNRSFTHHGVVMVFLFMVPVIPTVFGNFFLPMMLGAPDVALPRLNLASFYVYCLGATILLLSLWFGGVDTGWTFYAPYATTSPTAVATAVFGVFVVGISSILTGLNFIVTVHTMRAKGMRWFRMPLFVWAIYATAIIQVLATPVLGLSLLLVGADHAFGMGVFDPALGGDPILFQHLFWFYSHPAVYIMILPAMGVVSEVVCTFSHNRPASYRAIAISSIGIAFIGFLTWGHHMFVSGMSMLDVGAFGILSMFVAIFSAIKVFTWTATLYRGRITFNAPMLYFFGFMFLFVFGGMTGVAVATSSLDIHWHDTYFVVAHFHFIMVGGTLTMFLAACHYWFPKMFGRRYPEKWALIGAVAVILGFVFTFTPQFLLGNAGMPRRYHTYVPEYQWLNVMSTAGATILALGLVVTLVYLVHSIFRGEKAGDNPWDSRGYEWLAPTPPPTHNFHTPLVIARGPYDFHCPERP
ncbi:MAG: cbb3-type cytochrome c oxidase subunit I [Deltaproteobacteria bacterium]|nr:cbb3-type cytochrome c oxidase subunit I [Deltaproteobacteria bacterium]MCW5804632.1 cbb3-type cytochrome c oxidase subunit I [Deltaproteobacteria bacterium]